MSPGDGRSTREGALSRPSGRPASACFPPPPPTSTCRIRRYDVSIIRPKPEHVGPQRALSTLLERCPSEKKCISRKSYRACWVPADWPRNNSLSGVRSCEAPAELCGAIWKLFIYNVVWEVCWLEGMSLSLTKLTMLNWNDLGLRVRVIV